MCGSIECRMELQGINLYGCNEVTDKMEWRKKRWGLGSRKGTCMTPFLHFS